MLSTIDQDRIEAAVAKAEEGSSGEIVCVLASEVATYREVPLAWAAAVALALPPIALALGVVHPLSVAIGDAWMAAQPSALESDLGLVLAAYATLQVLLFVLTALVVAIPAVWFYNYLTGRMEYFNVEMDNSSSELVDYFIKKTA